MTRSALRRFGVFLGPVVLALGCAPGTASSGTGTQSTSTGDDDSSSSSSSSGGSSSGGSSGTGTSGTGSTGTSSTGSSSTQDTTTTGPGCGVVRLADVAAGLGGFVLDGEVADDRSGSPVSGAGDVNGDGLADVVVGAVTAKPNGPASSRTYVVFGKADTSKVSLADVADGIGGFALDGEPREVYLPPFGPSAGLAVSGAGDVNGDGLADVVVGARHITLGNGIGIYAGRAYLVFGKQSTERMQLADVALGNGGFAMDAEIGADFNTGRMVGAAGDVNGDGLADVLVGADDPEDWGMGDGWYDRTYVVFGKEGTDPVALADVALGTGGFAINGEAHEHDAGRSASGAGDINGDGLADVVLGAHYVGTYGDMPGRSYVVFGKASTDRVELTDVVLGNGGFAMDGESYDHVSGSSVSGAGDVNGDGRPDVLVAAPGASPNGAHSGRAYVVSGKEDTESVLLADVVQGTGGFAIDGEEDRGVHSVSGAGDINGDGLADVMMTSPAVAPMGNLRRGRIYVVFGTQSTDNVQLSDVAHGIGGFVILGEPEADYSGGSVSDAGDVNGDGVPDIIVGAGGSDANGLYDSGRTYVVFGGDFSCGGG